MAFNFAAAAQSVVTDPNAVQVESGANLVQPLSLMQRYVPTARKTDQNLQLLVDNSQTGEPQAGESQAGDSQAAVSHGGPMAQADEVATRPAINALRPGHFALTVSQVSRSER